MDWLVAASDGTAFVASVLDAAPEEDAKWKATAAGVSVVPTSSVVLEMAALPPGAVVAVQVAAAVLAAVPNAFSKQAVTDVTPQQLCQWVPWPFLPSPSNIFQR